MEYRHIKEILQFSWMVIISRFAAFLIIFSDIAALSGGSTTGLAAFATGNYLNTVCWLLGYNFLSGVRVYLTHALGDRDDAMASVIILVGIRLSAWTALALFLISASSWVVLPTFKYEAGLAEMIAGITVILGVGLFFQLYHVVISYFFEAHERPSIPMFIVLFGLALNVAGNSLIVSFDVSHAHWIAVVTTVSRLAMAIAAWIAFRRFFEKRSAVGQDKEAPARKKIIQFGWATTISAAGTMVLAVFGLIAGLKGVVVAAAFQIILNLAQFCLNFINGILTGVSVKVGKAYTASRPAEVRYYAWSGMAINFGLSVILFGFFVLFSDPILGLYTESQEVVGETLSLLLSVGLAFLLADAFVRVCSVTARSIGNRTYTTVLTVLTYVSSVVAGYVLCVVYQAEIIVLFYSMIAANLMIGFGIMIRFPPYFIPSAQTVSQ